MINNDKKITLAVIFGGVSSEHDISCISAKGIVSNIDYNKYNLILLGITKDGRWFIFNDNIELLPEDKWLNSKSLVPAYISPDSSVHGIVTAKGEIIKLDCVFPVLHDQPAEHSLQGFPVSVLRAERFRADDKFANSAHHSWDCIQPSQSRPGLQRGYGARYVPRVSSGLIER